MVLVVISASDISGCGSRGRWTPHIWRYEHLPNDIAKSYPSPDLEVHFAAGVLAVNRIHAQIQPSVDGREAMPLRLFGAAGEGWCVLGHGSTRGCCARKNSPTGSKLKHVCGHGLTRWGKCKFEAFCLALWSALSGLLANT